MDSEHTVYLTNIGSSDIYPHNSADAFTNRLRTPLYLNPNREYEVSLHSLLYPTEHYLYEKNNSPVYNIEIKTFLKGKKGDVENGRFVYEFNHDITSNTPIEHIIRIINEEIFLRVSAGLKDQAKKVLPIDNKVLKWNNEHKKLMICYKRETAPIVRGDYNSVTLNFSPEFCELLGFKNNIAYEIYGKEEDHFHLASFPINLSRNIQYFYIYTDIVERSYFGDQMANILDCISVSKEHNSSMHNLSYKKVSSNFFQDISIRITDQFGRSIPFEKTGIVTCVLHIRPR